MRATGCHHPIFLCRMALASYRSHIERSPAYLQAELELGLTELSEWSLDLLRSNTKQLVSKGGLSSGPGAVSRFILCGLSLLTDTHHTVGIATLLNNGILPLTMAISNSCHPVPLVDKDPLEESDEAGNEGRKQVAPVSEEVTGPSVLNRVVPGVRVVRGPDWKWGDQVRGPGCVVKGPGCVVRGPGCVVRGQGCVVKGQGCVVRGPGYVVKGPG